MKKTENCLILGLDIGGANTKAALLKFKYGKIKSSFSYIEYFPFWEKTKDHLNKLFKRIISKLVLTNGFRIEEIDYFTITMTAELSDAFQTKKEGVITILKSLSDVFEKEKLFFITLNNEYVQYNEAIEKPLLLAAANWVSTALYLGIFESNCILIDAGSTTIDLIPIYNSFPKTKGKTDIERLITHELIYTGGLRTTIPSITHQIPYNGNLIRISFENFALISDVHRILNNISKKEYINDTADNRSTSLDDCYARLARMICTDLTMISRKELDKIALYIYDQQKKLIKFEIQKFLQNLDFNKYKCLFVITGLSAEFLIKSVLEALGYKNIKKYEKITKIPDHISSSAFAVAGAFYHHFVKSHKND